MKRLILVLICVIIGLISFSQKRHPYYGGGRHTTSHGGYYAGGSGSSHKGGHYVNRDSYNTYGRHKRG